MAFRNFIHLKSGDFNTSNKLSNKRFAKKCVVCMVYMTSCPHCTNATEDYFLLKKNNPGVLFAVANVEDQNLTNILLELDSTLNHVPAFMIFENGNFVLKTNTPQNVQRFFHLKKNFYGPTFIL